MPTPKRLEEFEGSNLNLMSRCFNSLPDKPSRLAIIDKLHSEIDKSIRAADVEIALPQRDHRPRSSDVKIPNAIPNDGNVARGLHERRGPF